MLWAISQQTAAELVYRRVDASLPLLGMLSYDKKDSKSIQKQEVSIAKNYLNEEEMKLYWVCLLSSIWPLQKPWHNNKCLCI